MAPFADSLSSLIGHGYVAVSSLEPHLLFLFGPTLLWGRIFSLAYPFWAASFYFWHLHQMCMIAHWYTCGIIFFGEASFDYYFFHFIAMPSSWRWRVLNMYMEYFFLDGWMWCDGYGCANLRIRIWHFILWSVCVCSWSKRKDKVLTKVTWFWQSSTQKWVAYEFCEGSEICIWSFGLGRNFLDHRGISTWQNLKIK